METRVIPRQPSVVRALMLHDLCFPLFYSKNSTTIENKAVFVGVGRVCVNISHVHIYISNLIIE